MLSLSQKNERQNIAKRGNNAPPLRINRRLGSKESTYYITAFTDTSRGINGCATCSRKEKSEELKFVCAIYRLVCKAMDNESMPAL